MPIHAAKIGFGGFGHYIGSSLIATRKSTFFGLTVRARREPKNKAKEVYQETKTL